jgi:hypothetical protein
MLNWLWRRRVACCPYCGRAWHTPVCEECAARVREVRPLLRPRGMRAADIVTA